MGQSKDSPHPHGPGRGGWRPAVGQLQPTEMVVAGGDRVGDEGPVIWVGRGATRGEYLQGRKNKDSG